MYEGKNIVIGTHGTALSTIINYYDSTYGYDDFERMKADNALDCKNAG